MRLVGDGTRLFGRTVRVVVGDLDVSDLDVAFTVKKTLKSTPNTCDLQISNLSPDSIARLQTFSAVPCRLEAGYGSDLSQLYFGELRAAWTEYDEAGGTTTHVSTDTNAKSKKLSKIYQPVGAKIPASTVMGMIIKALGAKPGAPSRAAAAKLAKVVTLHPKPAVLSGNAWQVMDDFCRSADLEWSIQDGVVQVLDYNGVLDDTAVQLSADTGLVGSPTVDSNGVVEAKCLMIPDLRPGRKISVTSRFVTGGYRITECKYTGSNFGPEFYCELKGKKY